MRAALRADAQVLVDVFLPDDLAAAFALVPEPLGAELARFLGICHVHPDISGHSPDDLETLGQLASISANPENRPVLSVVVGASAQVWLEARRLGSAELFVKAMLTAAEGCTVEALHADSDGISFNIVINPSTMGMISVQSGALPADGTIIGRHALS